MAEPSPWQSLVGRTVAGYDVIEELGHGGMGVVYRAVDRKLGRSVALKLLAEARDADDDARERFLREARSASALDHPNIGTIYGMEELPEAGLCIVMAFYEGKTLAEKMARRRLTLPETLSIAIQVADGLAAAHRADIIHRDVKPSNVMLTANGLVKVVDFGLAKLTSDGEGLTKTATVVGTASYMSPEQARGQLLDARTDIWSLGVMLYQCASGVLPFRGADAFAVLYSVVHDEPPPLSGIYPDFGLLIRKAMAKDPAQRFESMSELAGELRRISGVLEMGDAMETQAMGSVSDVQPVREPSGTSATPRGQPIGMRLVWIGAGVVLLLLAVVAAIPALRQRMIPAGIHSPIAGKAPAADTHTTLAVLPFTGTDPGTSALAAGLAQRLSVRLTKLESFRDSLTILPPVDLLARSVSDGDDAIHKLGATMVVSGSLTHAASGDTLALEIRDPRRPQSELATIENADIGALEDRTVEAVARVLEIQANPQTTAALWRTGASVAAAYEPYLRGMGYLQRWDKAESLEQARAEFTQAAAMDPQFALAQAGLAETARIAYRSNREPADLQAALGYAQQAVRLDPKLPDAHVTLGKVYLEMAQQRDLAVIEFQRALELDPRSSDAIAGMGAAYVALGRDADAEAAFKQAVRLRPWSWAAYNSLASYYFKKASYANAEAQYRKALEIAPDSAAVYSNLGLTLLSEDKPDEAAKMYRLAIQLEPDYRTLNNLAILDYAQRNFRAAAEDYRRALELNDKNFIVWGSLGQALMHSGAPRTEAEKALRSAISLGEEQLQVHRDDVTTMALLALYQALLGNKSAALALVNDAMTGSGIIGAAAEYCAMAYEVTGDRTNAVRWAQKALDTGYTWKEMKGDVEMDRLVRSSNLRHSP